MRFLLKSAFWLIVAFIAIRPGIDINAAASSLTDQAMQAGQQAIATQIENTECDTLQCAGGKALIAAALASPAATSALRVQDASQAPLPRPRPAWLG